MPSRHREAEHASKVFPHWPFPRRKSPQLSRNPSEEATPKSSGSPPGKNASVSEGKDLSGAEQSSDGRRAVLFSGLRTVSLLTFTSRVLGMLRDMWMASLFGNGPIMDAFSVAFRIPNLARRLFGEGALSTAFLPSFIQEHEQSGAAAAGKLASGVLTVLAVVLGGLVVVGEILLWLGLRAVAPGSETAMLLRLSAIMLPYLLFICLVAQISAIMHGLRHFIWPALEAIVLNVIWLACLWWVASWFESKTTQIQLIAASVVVAGVVQLLAPLPTLRRLGFRFDRDWRAAGPKIKAIALAMFPVVIGLSIEQLNTFFDSLIAWGFSRPQTGSEVISWLPGSLEYPLEPGTASALYFGQRVYQFPLGVFGVALSTVIFPLLSQHAGQGRMDRLREDFSLGLRLVFYIGIPASVGLMILATPLTSLLFRHGEFTADDARQTAQMIWGYGIGVWAYCGVLILQRGYYAVGDRVTPLRIGFLGIVVDLTMNLTLIWPWGALGLALSTALSAILQFALIAWLVQERIGRLDWSSLAQAAGRAATGSGVMGIVCLGVLWILPDGTGLAARCATVLIPLVVALAAYFSMAWWLGMSEIWLLFRRERRG